MYFPALTLAPGLSLSSRHPNSSVPNANSSSADTKNKLTRQQDLCAHTCSLTSELGGEQEGLEQGVEVARPSLVPNATQFAPSSGSRRLVSRLGKSGSPRGREDREARFTLVAILLEEIPKHDVSFAFMLLRKRATLPLAISSWSCPVLG